MAEVKWIKIVTGFFDDEKIKLIEAMPEADMLIVIWIRLLTLAGKNNMNGFIFLTQDIPYTDEMLSTIMNRPLNSVRLALDVFKKFKMIEFDNNNNLKITNWEKHQNIEGLEKIREQNRLRQQRYRESQKQIPAPKKELEEGKEESNATVTSHNETDKNRLEEIRLEDNILSEIISYLNTKTNKNFKATTGSTKRLITARLNEGYTLADFQKVIDNKVESWAGKKTADGQSMDNYLRPQTLFGTKFESYLNETKEVYGYQGI